MKAAGAAILDGKPVNAVASGVKSGVKSAKRGVTHMTIEQYVRKSELLQTPYVDQFMSQLKFSKMKKRERCPIIFYARQRFITLFLENNPAIQKDMSKLILTDYISVANKEPM